MLLLQKSKLLDFKVDIKSADSSACSRLLVKPVFRVTRRLGFQAELAPSWFGLANVGQVFQKCLRLVLRGKLGSS